MANTPAIAEPDIFPDIAGPEAEEPAASAAPAAASNEKPPYDPTMDPGHARWNPKKFFDAEPKDIIVLKRNESDVLGDPNGETIIEQPVGINGYTIYVKKGVPTKVPRSFANMLVSIGAAYRYADIPEVG